MSPFAVSQWFPKRLVPALLAAAALTAVLILGVLLRDEAAPNRPDGLSESRGRFPQASRASHSPTSRIQSLRKPSDAPPNNTLKRPADLEYQFLAEGDLYRRVEVARDLGTLDDDKAVGVLLDLLKTEAEPEVREALLMALCQSPARARHAGDIFIALEMALRTCGDQEVRIAVIRAAGSLDTGDSVDMLRRLFDNAELDPVERAYAGTGLLRIAHNCPSLVPPEVNGRVVHQMRLEAQATPDPACRAEVIRALAETGDSGTRSYLLELLAKEKDPSVKSLLEKLTL